MKKILMISLIFMAFIKSYSQTNVSLVDTNKVWSILSGSYTPGGSSSGSKFYKLSGDSVINSLKYNKIYICSDSAQLKWDISQQLIRESNGKVYKREYGGNDVLIYDFNLKLKDTISLGNMFEQFKNWVVDSIDSIKLRNTYYKRIFLGLSGCDGCPKDIWISGIGSLYGILYSGNLTPDFSTDLLCVKDKNGYLFMNSNFNSCYQAFVGINNISVIEDIQLYPTLIKNNFTIKTKLNSYNVLVFNTIGTIIYQKRHIGETEINCSGFISGVYLVKIMYENKQFTKKVIKQ
jgi:hypothetical protein